MDFEKFNPLLLIKNGKNFGKKRKYLNALRQENLNIIV